MSKQALCRCIFRPSQQPATDLPLGARSVGHYLVPSGYRDNVLVKPFVQVFWGIAGTGALVINGRERLLGPQQVAIYLPGMEHRIYALATPWEYRWWTMDGPLAGAITVAFGLTADVYKALPAPVDLFKKLEKTIRNLSPDGERRGCALAFELLALAAGGRHLGNQDQMVSQAIKIIHHQWNDANLSVKTLANALHIHRSILTRRFHQATGNSPVAYITRLRIQNALSLLKQTDKSVADIAALCGYSDPNYFSRMVRHTIGMAPLYFRGHYSP